MRPLRDRLAELIRRARLGSSGGPFDALPPDTREEWCRSADLLLALSPDLRIDIREAS